MLIFRFRSLLQTTMSFRLPAIEVSDDTPFANDALDREKIVNFVAGIVGDTGGHPLVLAIDSPYGTGKSTFVDMLGKVLNQKNFRTVYFNAWKADHVSDPLIAMVAALDEAFPHSEGDSEIGAVNMARVKKIAGILLKRGAAVGVKIATAGVVDLSDDLEEALGDTAADATSDVIEAFEKEEEAAKCFKAELEKVVTKLPELNKKPTLVFFIDELDRCRPDFAMSLLERVKHMFDVPNMAFVLSVDKKQLEAVTAAVYGEKIDAPEYLRKFIDLEFGLPSPSKEAFIKNAFTRAGLDEKFATRQHADKDQIVRFITLLVNIYGMSLRAIERCIVRLKLVLAVTPENHGLHAIQIALLIVLRSVDKEMFDQVAHRKIDPLRVMEHFRSLPNSRGLLDEIEGLALETMLVAELADNQSRGAYRSEQRVILDRTGLTDDERNKAQLRLQMLDSFSRDLFGGNRLSRIAATIDIAANVRG